MGHRIMSLKDEIEKMIQAEQAKLEIRDQKERDYHETQRDRFAPLKEVLREITNAIDRKYTDLSISDDRATISLGYRSNDLHWVIGPDFDVRFGAASDEGLFESRPGFRLEETIYHYGGDFSESTKNFDCQQSLVEYLVTNLVERTAQFRHLNSTKPATDD
jgi:hypothetical protein